MGKIGKEWRNIDPTKLILLVGIITSMPVSLKIDQELNHGSTHKQTDALTQTVYRSNVRLLFSLPIFLYNLSHAICYSYGADNNEEKWTENRALRNTTERGVRGGRMIRMVQY